MEARYRLNGPALRRLRVAHGYPSAEALAHALQIPRSRVYRLENGQVRVTTTEYNDILHLFGLEDGALKATGTPCPRCGHVETANRNTAPEETDEDGTGTVKGLPHAA
ncbi:helix-turn-helix domain-containing protein [Nocardiopsis sp. FR26]|uniref:helix-turn-helix domain-containing protein n=1 Tax=Nocardiopsis sp. FR26 TaxID=2605987 RepID=UPI001357B37A|nr:helix-turn-helix transcriptional regulator [Nocardiopsis sp. FR26]